MKSRTLSKNLKDSNPYVKRKGNTRYVATTLKIGEISEKSGIPVVTLRFFEKERLIWSAADPKSGQRRFSPTVLTDLDFIKLCRNSGFTIPETRSMMKLWQGFKLPSKTNMGALKRSIDSIRRQMRGLEAVEKILLFRLQNPDGDIEVLLMDEPELLNQLDRAGKGT
jgi:DNA-binding transcriptional MerR regulator